MSDRKTIEEEVKPIITLVVIQAAFNLKNNTIDIMTQEIETLETDFTYNISGTRVTNDSFGKPFPANDNALSPLIVCIDRKENQEVATEAIRAFMKEHTQKELNNLVVKVEGVLKAIEADAFRELDDEGKPVVKEA